MDSKLLDTNNGGASRIPDLGLDNTSKSSPPIINLESFDNVEPSKLGVTEINNTPKLTDVATSLTRGISSGSSSPFETTTSSIRVSKMDHIPEPTNLMTPSIPITGAESLVTVGSAMSAVQVSEPKPSNSKTLLTPTMSSESLNTAETTKAKVAPVSELTPPSTRTGSPTRARPMQYHALATLKTWERLTQLRHGDSVVLDGESLDVASVVAVAKFGSGTILKKSEKVLGRINGSVAMLRRHLDEDHMVYGVNTGFGGSADVRTTETAALQHALVQHQNSGILASEDMMRSDSSSHLDFHTTSMPTSWSRGLMLARLNSIIRGHSAVSLEIIETIVAFLEKNLTPVIPVRGSISASGDLIPLSYLAGCIQGNPDIYMRVGKYHGDSRTVSAAEALKAAEIKPIVLGAKEGLGLLNGTAASASVASLAIYESNQLALLSQVLTAMGCEALKGTAESFHPFIAAARPHKGQVEAAANILGFLSGSRLANDVNGHRKDVEGLAQDRYALRTSSQWAGPQLEDLMLATEQVTVELNSTTDNPLIDVAADTVHHGGNFQAASITSAMEKTRLSIQMFAKMLFAQCTEIINPALNRGLPPNLCADDPSLSFTCKGIDISMAGYYSEIAFLSNPVSTHVQSAEMHNQALNSLALISARYTLQVVEIASMMCASYLVMVCQALDLRVLQMQLVEKFRPKVVEMANGIIQNTLVDPHDGERIVEAIWISLVKAWNATTCLDLQERCEKTGEAASATLFSEIAKKTEFKCSTQDLFAAINTWRVELSVAIRSIHELVRDDMFQRHIDITPEHLGQASKKLYLFVRKDLRVPFHRGLVEDPTHPLGDKQASFPAGQRRTIGSLISIVYEAVRDGRAHEPVMAAVKENMI